jgi:hypothetical protein
MTALERRHVWNPPRPAPAKTPADEGAMSMLARMAEAAGAPPSRLLRDFASLAIGPGHISFSDYERLRLYDEAFWSGSDRRWVVGARRGRQLALQANFRHDWLGMASNRVAWSSYLSAHGLPSVPTEAIYAPGLATPATNVLRTKEELRQFLEARCDRPLVARGAEAGRVRLLFAEDRRPAHLDHLVDEIAETGGQLFQPLIEPHSATVAAGGARLVAVRLITLGGEGELKVTRAVWKPPGRAALLAQIDLRSGEIMRLTNGVGPDLVEVRRGSLPLAALPDWEPAKAAAIEAARVFKHLGIIGWDVAFAAEGPLILGMTATPDLLAHQIVDRRGLLDDEFFDFLESQRRLAAEHAELTKAEAAWA